MFHIHQKIKVMRLRTSSSGFGYLVDTNRQKYLQPVYKRLEEGQFYGLNETNIFVVHDGLFFGKCIYVNPLIFWVFIMSYSFCFDDK